MMECEVYAGKVSVKARRILRAMHAAAGDCGVNAHLSSEYKGNCELFMTWGLGHPVRRQWTDQHVKNGGTVIAWDLGYWNRTEYFRLTINDDHPQKYVRDMPGTRSKGITLRDDYCADGHIVIVGMGKKSTAIYDGAAEWQDRAVRKVRATYPDRKIIIRPKYQNTPIESVLRGASLVVCRHSNVALDACIAGIPVVCDDGIASSLYGNDLANPVIATEKQRRQLIDNAGWWQWSPREADQAWQHILHIL